MFLMEIMYALQGYEDFSNIDVDILIHLSDTVKNLKEAVKRICVRRLN